MTLSYTSEQGIRSDTRTLIQDLVGMQLTATYTDGTTETFGWEQTGAWAAGLDHDSTDFDMTFHWYGYRMTMSKRLASFEFDLSGAGMIWDAGDYPDHDPRNSPTTLIGSPFSISEGNDDTLAGTILASYAGRVQIGDHTTGEDAFTRLKVDFTGLAEGGFLGTLLWNSDSDVLADRGDLYPTPLPAAGLLLLAGLGSLGASRSLRRKPD